MFLLCLFGDTAEAAAQAAHQTAEGASNTAWTAVAFSAIATLGVIANSLIAALKDKWRQEGDKTIALKTATLEQTVEVQGHKLTESEDEHKKCKEELSKRVIAAADAGARLTALESIILPLVTLPAKPPS